ETSELTLAESLVKPMADRDAELAERYFRVLAPQSGIEVREVSREVLILAARIRAEKRVKLPDAIHLATAQATGCDRFVSNDGGLAKAWPKEFMRWGEL
ncbi:MAG: PIN domain-containing protein, partial [Nitratireductor sp.]|nr:PIN domain-containing protein [Nitratireductor sp.]